MNPLTNVKNITKLNETELATGSIHKKSWHDIYKDSAWVFIGGLEYGLTEGDVITVFSQYGEVENINLVRDKKTGKSKGYCFLCYSNQKSTVLAVDNLNGIKLCHRTIRVDHVANYKPPKENERDDDITKILKSEGCAPQVAQKLVAKGTSEVKNDGASEDKSKKKKSKKEKKEKKKKKKNRSASRETKDMHDAISPKIKQERHDSGYDKYNTSSHEINNANKRHLEKRNNNSTGECSYSTENDRSKISRKYKIKSEPESDGEYFEAVRRDNGSQNTSSKKHKRKKSPSSSSDEDDQISNARKKYRFSNERDESERHLEHKRKSRKVEQSSSSSSDDASSTQSSSEDEKRDSRYHRKDKIHYENRSNRENSRDRSCHRADKDVEINKSKTKYDDKDNSYYKNSHNDRDESYYKDSHHYKKKSNK